MSAPGVPSPGVFTSATTAASHNCREPGRHRCVPTRRRPHRTGWVLPARSAKGQMKFWT